MAEQQKYYYRTTIIAAYHQIPCMFISVGKPGKVVHVTTRFNEYALLS